jgi:hypothetical protein
MFALAAHAAAPATAGVVAPPIASDSAPAENAVVPSQNAAERFNADYVPALATTGSNESQPFWFPGADRVGSDATPMSISSTPIQSDPAVPGLHGMQQHPLIPLPGAAWTGMAGLLGLGAAKLLRNARRLLS